MRSTEMRPRLSRQSAKDEGGAVVVAVMIG